jgi:hypothetical protein
MTRDGHTRWVRALHWLRDDHGFRFVLDERRRIALVRFEEARPAAALA